MTAARLYLITPPRIDAPRVFSERLADVLAAAAGTPAAVACVQLRLKDVSDAEILAAAEAIGPVCAEAGAGLILNDRADLVAEAGADGVHLGQDDGPPRAARELLGPDRDIGVTCHNSVHLAMEAGEAGADYVAFGAFFDTTTKAVEYRAEPDILARWSKMATIPSVAIGGITPATAPALVSAGADYVAVSGAVWSHTDGPIAAIDAFARALG